MRKIWNLRRDKKSCKPETLKNFGCKTAFMNRVVIKKKYFFRIPEIIMRMEPINYYFQKSCKII